MPDARPTTPMTPWSHAMRSVRMPVVSRRSVSEAFAKRIRSIVGEVAFNVIQFCHHLLDCKAVRSRATPPTRLTPRRNRDPVSRSLSCMIRSFRRPQCACATA